MLIAVFNSSSSSSGSYRQRIAAISLSSVTRHRGLLFTEFELIGLHAAVAVAATVSAAVAAAAVVATATATTTTSVAAATAAADRCSVSFS